MKKPAAAPVIDPSAPSQGDFRSDGSWDENATGPRSELWTFVDMLVTKRRRQPETPPFEFAARIMRSPFKKAFPSALPGVFGPLLDWARMTVPGKSGPVPAPWWLAQTRTAAESAVKLAGYPIPSKDSHAILQLFELEARLRTDLPSTPELDALILNVLSKPQAAPSAPITPQPDPEVM